jgi:hypothetical protein
VYRRWHHHELTFSLVYAFTENFILPLSHDEVVHGKGSLLNKMPGDRWQKLANLRALYGYMWSHPGKKLLFMGQEFAQESEWSHDRSLDWHLLERPEHAGIQSLVRDLNRLYKAEPALWEMDYDGTGFWWIEANAADDNVFAFARRTRDSERIIVVALNLSPTPRHRYRLGMPRSGHWRELLNTDSGYYGGSDQGNLGGDEAEGVAGEYREGQLVALRVRLAARDVAVVDDRAEAAGQAGGGDDERERDLEHCQRHKRGDRETDQHRVGERTLGDPDHRVHNDREHRGGEPGEQRGHRRGRSEGDVNAGQGKQREHTGQHEQRAGDQPAGGAVQQPADVDRELLRFRAG